MGTTTNYELPVYQNGDIAGFLTSEGWNDAMNAVDNALKNVADSVTSNANLTAGITYVGVCEKGATTSDVSIPDITEDDKLMITSNRNVIPESATITAGTGVTVTWGADATAENAISFNLTVYKVIKNQEV